MGNSFGRSRLVLFLAMILCIIGICAASTLAPPATTRAPPPVTTAPPKTTIIKTTAAPKPAPTSAPEPEPATPAPPVTRAGGKNYVVRIKNETLPNPEVDRVNQIVKDLGQEPLPPANITKELIKASDKRIRNITLYLNELTEAEKPKDFSYKPFNIFNVIVLLNPSVEILNEVKSFPEVEKVENVDDGFWINGKYAKIVDANNPVA